MNQLPIKPEGDIKMPRGRFEDFKMGETWGVMIVFLPVKAGIPNPPYKVERTGRTIIDNETVVQGKLLLPGNVAYYIDLSDEGVDELEQASVHYRIGDKIESLPPDTDRDSGKD